MTCGSGPPHSWLSLLAWEEGFGLSEADDRYSEISPYAGPRC